MQRDDLRQNPSNLASVHLGLNLFALSRIGSLSHTRSPKPANSVPNLRPINRLNGVSPWRVVPSTLSDVGQHRGPQARSPQQLTAFVVLTRPPTVKMALSAIPLPAESPGGLISSTVVVPSARSSRTRRMSSQRLGSPSVVTVTSWHPNPSIHFTSKRAECGSPPPFIETAAANVMPVRLSFATDSGVD